MKKFIVIFAALVASLFVAVDTASAHHPVLSGTVARPCGEQAAWTATFKAESDADYNKDWQSRYQIDGGSWTATGAWVDDQVDFGPFNLGPYAANKPSVTIQVESWWGAKSNHNNDTAHATASLTLNRPAATQCPVVTTTTIPATTTTVPVTTIPATTTTVPATTTTVQATTTTVAATTTIPVTTIPVTTVPVTTEAPTTTIAATTTVPASSTTEIVVIGTPPAPTTTAFIPVPPEVLETTELPATGADDAPLLIGAMLVVAGAAVLYARRRTRV